MEEFKILQISDQLKLLTLGLSFFLMSEEFLLALQKSMHLVEISKLAEFDDGNFGYFLKILDGVFFIQFASFYQLVIEKQLKKDG